LLGLHKQKDFAIEMKNALLQRKLNNFGELLHQAWQYKKKMSPKISNPHIERIYRVARHHGAVGGKITGAGGGGYLIFFCKSERKHAVAQSLKRLGVLLTDFIFEFHGLQTWRVANE
jgi:D-glycero-alpha-D-manno-heptose-7-phosphate kinase